MKQKARIMLYVISFLLLILVLSTELGKLLFVLAMYGIGYGLMFAAIGAVLWFIIAMGG